VEDNDTESSEEEEEEDKTIVITQEGVKKKQITLKSKHALEYFIQEEKKVLKKKYALNLIKLFPDQPEQKHSEAVEKAVREKVGEFFKTEPPRIIKALT
jgi:hypothetical protein